MNIKNVRQVLWEFIQNTPDGTRKLAKCAIQVLPQSSLKKLIEALCLEDKVKAK